MNLTALFEKCAQHYGTRLALTDLGTGETLDFRALHLGLRQVASRLALAGILPGERVALLGLNEIDYLVCDYGVMNASRVRVPLDPALSCDEQVSQVRDAGARVLLFTPHFAERASQIAGTIEGLQTIPMAEARSAAAATEPLPAYPAPDTLASLSYTGGTTGGPKAVMVTHGSLTAAVQNIVGARGMGPGDVMLNIRPAWPIAAIVVLAHLAAGGSVLLAGRFEPAAFLHLLEAHKVACTSLVPTHLTRIMNEADPAAYDLSMLRAMDVGAAAIGPELFARVLDAFGPRVGIIYGLTEAPWSCYQSPSALAGDAAVQARHMKTVGRPLFGTELVIRNAEGHPVGAGEEGEITLRGTHVTPGYWRRPEADAAAFRDGWFLTGDLGSMSEDGFLSITGRLKELIRSGGKSVVPAEVESVLRLHPDVADAAVLGLPDAEWGEIVAAVVVLKAGTHADADALMAWCRERLSSFKKPRRVFFVDEIPRSHYGKALRARLLQAITALL
ncbi:MAG: long-chain fatty acid--CoA ligase [Polaromonas sp.]|nr:long-chain fatty acid--CoA ligase [Polaromonas sp.]